MAAGVHQDDRCRRLRSLELQAAAGDLLPLAMGSGKVDVHDRGVGDEVDLRIIHPLGTVRHGYLMAGAARDGIADGELRTVLDPNTLEPLKDPHGDRTAVRGGMGDVVLVARLDGHRRRGLRPLAGNEQHRRVVGVAEFARLTGVPVVDEYPHAVLVRLSSDDGLGATIDDPKLLRGGNDASSQPAVAASRARPALDPFAPLRDFTIDVAFGLFRVLEQPPCFVLVAWRRVWGLYHPLENVVRFDCQVFGQFPAGSLDQQLGFGDALGRILPRRRRPRQCLVCNNGRLGLDNSLVAILGVRIRLAIRKEVLVVHDDHVPVVGDDRELPRRAIHRFGGEWSNQVQLDLGCAKGLHILLQHGKLTTRHGDLLILLDQRYRRAIDRLHR